MENLWNLVLVCCHSIYLRGPVTDESSWALLSYQQANGHLPLMLEHIRCACQLARSMPASLLVFSGGQTRAGIQRTEGESHVDVAEQLGYLDGIPAHRVTYEACAQDSFQNAAFGWARFVEVAGRLPTQTVVVGWEFKRARILAHASQLTSDPNSCEYVGVNNPPASHLPNALSSEEKIRALFQADPMGLGPELLAKKRERNWARRRHGYLHAVRPVSANLAAILETQFEY